MIEPASSGAALVAALEQARDDGRGVVCRLGQAGVAMVLGGSLVVVDPYLSNHCEAALPRPFDHRRMTRAPLDPAELTTVDVVACSHDHLDHLDVPTMRTLATASPRATAVAPLTCRAQLTNLDWPDERIVSTRAGDQVRTGGVIVDAVAAAHEGWDVDPELGNPYQGYVIDGAGVRVAHVGDALAEPATAEALGSLSPDVLFLPINGRDAERAAMGFAGNMTAEEAAEFAKTAGAPMVIPMHYDMFAQNVDADAESRFVAACANAGVRTRALAVGEVVAVDEL